MRLLIKENEKIKIKEFKKYNIMVVRYKRDKKKILDYKLSEDNDVRLLKNIKI